MASVRPKLSFFLVATFIHKKKNLSNLQKIQAQIRPISQNQTTTIGQTQVRMISPVGPGGPRPIGHTTITKQPAGIRIQGPTNAPRLVNAQIRGPIPASIQQANTQLPSAPTQAVSHAFVRV